MMVQSVAGSRGSDIVSTANKTANLQTGSANGKIFQDYLSDKVAEQPSETPVKDSDDVIRDSMGRIIRKKLDNFYFPAETEEEAQSNLQKLKSMSAEELRNMPPKERSKMLAKSMTGAQGMMIGGLGIERHRVGVAASTGSMSGDMERDARAFAEQLRLHGGSEPNYEKIISVCKDLAEIYKKLGK